MYIYIIDTHQTNTHFYNPQPGSKQQLISYGSQTDLAPKASRKQWGNPEDPKDPRDPHGPVAYTFDLQATQHDEISWLLYNPVGGSVGLVAGSCMTTQTFLPFIYQQRKHHGIVQLLLSWSFI